MIDTYKPMNYTQAEDLARSESLRLICEIFIYRLKNGRFRITSDKRTIPLSLGASLHGSFGPPEAQDEEASAGVGGLI